MFKSKVKEYRSLVWLRRTRVALAAEDARGSTSRAVRERQRKVDELIAKLDLKRISSDAARSRSGRLS